MAKIITGIRRCGKSYLLNKIFYDHLISSGVDRDHIISIDLDLLENEPYRDPHALYEKITETVKDDDSYYVLLDEVQLVDGFESIVNSLLRRGNIDVYVTGSNSKMLSTDVVTEFRGRGDEVRLRPLSFSEFTHAYPSDTQKAWSEYMVYGGMPELLKFGDGEQKASYLKDLVQKVYLLDIEERHKVKDPGLLEDITDVLSSAIGSLTNPTRLKNVLRNGGRPNADEGTIAKYISWLEDSFLFEESRRYDVKGNLYLSTPKKYYSADVGLRNARLNFRQTEYSHIMENVIYNELRSRGFEVDVGVVPIRETADGRSELVRLEIDFVANKGNRRYYVQSAYSLPDAQKLEQEIRPFTKVDDWFRRIVVTNDAVPRSRNSKGIVLMNVTDFLLDPESLDYRGKTSRTSIPSSARRRRTFSNEVMDPLMFIRASLLDISGRRFRGSRAALFTPVSATARQKSSSLPSRRSRTGAIRA